MRITSNGKIRCYVRFIVNAFKSSPSRHIHLTSASPATIGKVVAVIEISKRVLPTLGHINALSAATPAPEDPRATGPSLKATLYVQGVPTCPLLGEAQNACRQDPGGPAGRFLPAASMGPSAPLASDRPPLPKRRRLGPDTHAPRVAPAPPRAVNPDG